MPGSPEALMPFFRFSLTSPSSSQSDQLVVAFDDRAERGLDRFDSKKMVSTSDSCLQWYINIDENPMVIIALPLPVPAGYSQTDTLPLTVILPDDGYYEISLINPIPFIIGFDITLSLFHSITDNHSVSFSFILEDRLTGVRQLLRPDQPYAFSAGAGILEGRFMLTFGSMDIVEEWKCDNVIEENKWEILTHDETLEIVLFEIPKSKCYILLFDCIGNEIARVPVDLSSHRIILPKPISPGIYLVQIPGLRDYPVLQFFNN
jgi:hypothetical protein